MQFMGKVALITGAASGIGRAGAKLFAERGAMVVAVDIDRSGLDSVVHEIADAGKQAISITADLSCPDEAEAMVHEAAAKSGGLDLLWSNAGQSGPLEVDRFDSALYASTLNLNFTAAVRASTAAIGYLRTRGGGSILFTSSTSGLVGSPKYAIYSATKFALVGYAKTLAQQLASDGIRVNVICPGPVRTPLVDKLVGDPDGGGKQYQEWLVSAVPMARAAEPIEIAHAACWLASNEASYVTGIALPIDGGYTSR